MRMTLRLGFEGLEECVGGGARPAPAPGERDEDARGSLLGRGPRARWAELRAGKAGGARLEGERVGGRGGGGIMDDELLGDGSRESDGMGVLGLAAEALGVVWDSALSSSSSSIVGGCIVGGCIVGGGGGGGIASASLVVVITGTSCFSSPPSRTVVLLPSLGRLVGVVVAVVASGGPEIAAPGFRKASVHRANQAGTQPGGRTMTQMTEATISEIPMTAIYFSEVVGRQRRGEVGDGRGGGNGEVVVGWTLLVAEQRGAF